MSWLRNLQGQLTEFASEVLNEATEEVNDPESELQVSNKKCLELEQLLSHEVAKNSKLEAKVTSLAEDNLSRDNDISALNEKFENVIRGREDEIRRLKYELDQLRHSSLSDDFDDFDHQTFDTKAEIVHCRPGVSESEPSTSMALKLLEYEAKLQELQILKEHEIAALVEQHTHVLDEMKECYEEKIIALQGAASSSTSNVDLLDAVLLEKEELLEAKRKLEEIAKRRNSDDQPVIISVNDSEQCLDLKEKMDTLQIQLDEANDTINQLKIGNEKLIVQCSSVETTATNESDIDQLRLQNMELTAAYNELDQEFEKFKVDHSSVTSDNSNLSRRIDCLKSSLVEYEERYELCKRENSESLRQIESLTADFERLKIALDQASRNNVDQENEVSDSIVQLRNALERSDEDRRVLKEDIARFRDTMRSVEEELSPLRELNTRLVADNEGLRNTINMLNSKIDTTSIESEYVTESTELISSMKTEVEALQSQISALQDSLRCQSDMNSLLNKSITEEKEKSRLLSQKIELLEELKEELHPKIIKSEELNITVESLNIQLKEALLATTEKTDECERLRQRIEELEKELSARQSCVDDLIIQNNLLQVEYQNAADQTNEFRKSLGDKEQQFLELERQTIHIRDSETRLRDEAALYSISFSVEEDIVLLVSRTFKELRAEVDQLNINLVEKSKTCEELIASLKEATDNSTLHSEADVLRQQILFIKDENDKLKEIASQKHQECLEFYEKLNSALQRNSELEQYVRTQNVKLEEESSLNDKKVKELQRLKEHLLLIEETSTKEAVDAEKRETELREKLRDVQQRSHALTEGASETNSHQLTEIRDLRAHLETTEYLLQNEKMKYESEKSLRIETSAALTSLQVVVRELSTDHEKDSAAAAHRKLELQDEVNRLSKMLASLSEEIDKIGLDKQAAEENVDFLKSSLMARQKIIDDLELQLEDSRAHKAKSLDSYRVDDATLRNLFMSYFTARRDKQPDIALLLANILEYPSDDIDKIRRAVHLGTSEKTEASTSIAEQFIRFLEKESESSNTAPQLPVDHQNSQIAEERLLTSQTSASALHDILR